MGWYVPYTLFSSTQDPTAPFRRRPHAGSDKRSEAEIWHTPYPDFQGSIENKIVATPKMVFFRNTSSRTFASGCFHTPLVVEQSTCETRSKRSATSPPDTSKIRSRAKNLVV
ncbi:unnamed protein product [Ectocarpus sp. 6 AP-2014]